MPQQAQHAVHQLDEVLHGIAKQNKWLRALGVGMAVILAAGIVGAVLVGLKFTDLRNDDLDQSRQSREQLRIVAADNGLRGCRSDEQQDDALADLLAVVLRQPTRTDLSPEARVAAANTRAAFKARIRKAKVGRHCEDIPAMLLLSEEDREKILDRYPPAPSQ